MFAELRFERFDNFKAPKGAMILSKFTMHLHCRVNIALKCSQNDGQPAITISYDYLPADCRAIVCFVYKAD
jgi:hypothetical protein